MPKKPKTQPKKTVKKAVPKRAPARPTKAAKPYVTDDPRAAFAHFAARAAAITGEVPVARFDAAIARDNVEVGFAAAQPFFAELGRLAPSVDVVALGELPALALAVEFAADAVPLEARSDGSIDDAILELSQLRLDTLAFLEIAARRGLVEAERVAKVRAGHGKLDFARDCVAIPAIFADNAAALVNKHPFSADELALLTTKGAWLRDQLTPGGAPRRPAERHPAALTRDRYAKLLDDTYAELEKAAAAKWGVGAFRDHVPPLRSRARVKKDPKGGAGAGGADGGASGGSPGGAVGGGAGGDASGGDGSTAAQ